MKKSKIPFLAISLCMTAYTAHAQNSLQLYGVVDAGITRVSGLAGGTMNQVASGIMDGSRWGLKGQEDLGGGYQALFSIESRVELDTGAESNRPASGTQLPLRFSSTSGLGLPTALTPVVAGLSSQFGNTLGVNLANNGFDRQAYLGLVTPVGAIVAGRQYTPAYQVMANFDAMQTSSALSAGQLVSIPSGVDIRVSNALQYRIQLANITGALMYASGESAISSKANRLYGAMLSYKGQGYAFGAGYNTRNNEKGDRSLTNTVVGASAEVGPGTLSIMVNEIEDNNPTGLSTISTTLQAAPFGLNSTMANLVQSAYLNAFKQDARLLNIGYRYRFGKNTATVTYTKLDDQLLLDADAASYGIALSHALSKRTDLNFVLAKVVNSANSQTALGGAGYLGGVTQAPGVDSNSIALGLRHTF